MPEPAAPGTRSRLAVGGRTVAPVNDQSKDPGQQHDTHTSPSSERDVAALQRDQDDSPALDDPDIDRSAIKVLPGTGDYDDDGDVEVDPKDLHMPRLPGRAEAGPPSS